jgi:UDP-4-amino-4,6-dideoxy-N-acetyl-beta-L-altrosamine transaminase
MNKLKQIQYGHQDINQSDIDAVIEVLHSDFLTQGPVVPLFEKTIADYCGAKKGVATNSATSALHIACMALEVGQNDIVWTTPNTFVASANCALYCGATVDFVDINPATYNLSIESLEQKLNLAKKNGKLPKVVIPVHLCGQSCEMSEIHKLSIEFGFSIIEDASHAIGAKYKNEPVGNCRYSDITIFSFHPVKIITTGEGGMALTNNKQIADKMQRLRSHGITSDRELMQPRPSDEIWNYQQIQLGFNYRLPDMNAALGLNQFTRLTEFVSKRHEIVKIYDFELKDLPIQLPWQHPDAYSSFHLYPIRVNEKRSGKTQRLIYDGLQAANINVNLHYIPVYRQPYYESIGFTAGYCPEAEKYHKEAITIPIYPTLTFDEHNHIISILKGMF